VVFSATNDFYVRFGAAAAVPSVDVTNGSGSEVNPGARRIPEGVTSIGIASSGSCILTMAFYA
jgi:hypothetical protein